MALSDIIYQKSKQLPDDKAQAVIDYIDMLIKKEQNQEYIKKITQLTQEQRKAFSYLQSIKIDWQGKPIADREQANARR